MTKQTETLKLALEGAANYIDALGGDSRKYRQALAEQPAQQEPVAFSCLRCVTPKKCAIYGCSPNTWPSETPPASKPLTDEEIESINVRFAGSRDLARLFARAIEAAHGIKE